MTDNEKVFLTAEQAISVIAKRGDVHTFRSGGNVLVGADWRRKAIVKALNDAPEGSIEVGGEQCMRMGHGLVLWTGSDPLFIEADTDRLKELEKQLQP